MLTAPTHSEVTPHDVTFEPSGEHARPLALKAHIRSLDTEAAFEEVLSAPHSLSSGLLVISRHSGYKVGNFVDVVFPHLPVGEGKQPERAEIIHILQTNRGDLAIGLRFQPAV